LALAKVFNVPLAVTPKVYSTNSILSTYSAFITSSLDDKLNNCVPNIFLGRSSNCGISRVNSRPNLVEIFKNLFSPSKISVLTTLSPSLSLTAWTFE